MSVRRPLGVVRGYRGSFQQWRLGLFFFAFPVPTSTASLLVTHSEYCSQIRFQTSRSDFFPPATRIKSYMEYRPSSVRRILDPDSSGMMRSILGTILETDIRLPSLIGCWTGSIDSSPIEPVNILASKPSKALDKQCQLDTIDLISVEYRDASKFLH
jgi:hypothetical protein